MKYQISSAVCFVQYTYTVLSERKDPFSCLLLSALQLEATGASGERNSQDGSRTMQELVWQSDNAGVSLAV